MLTCRYNLPEVVTIFIIISHTNVGQENWDQSSLPFSVFCWVNPACQLISWDKKYFYPRIHCLGSIMETEWLRELPFSSHSSSSAWVNCKGVTRLCTDKSLGLQTCNGPDGLWQCKNQGGVRVYYLLSQTDALDIDSRNTEGSPGSLSWMKWKRKAGVRLHMLT